MGARLSNERVFEWKKFIWMAFIFNSFFSQHRAHNIIYWQNIIYYICCILAPVIRVLFIFEINFIAIFAHTEQCNRPGTKEWMRDFIRHTDIEMKWCSLVGCGGRLAGQYVISNDLDK